MYNHNNTSNTSLSDDNDDDDLSHSVFYPSLDNHPLTLPSAQWSKHRPPLPQSNSISKRSPMSELPPEVLIHILKHVHSPRDLFNILRVSRTWSECAVELLWHKPAFPRFSTLEKMARLLAAPEKTFTYGRFIRRLNFLTLGNDLKDDILSIFSQCIRLERLTLVNCEHLSADSLATNLPCFPNLVAIDLTGVVNVTSEAIVGLANSAQRLQGINLANCSQVTDSGIMALAENCPLLRRVKLSCLVLITDEPISALAKLCPLLLEIDLNHCELITDRSIRDIWKYSMHMREMRLSHCTELTDAAFPAPIRPETAAPVNAPDPFPSSQSKELDELPPLILSRSFDHLRMLDLTACSNITDDAVEGIISHAPKIRNLVLSKCGRLTDKSVENICRLGRHLHYLHLGHAAKITDRSVRTLARSCTRIRYIDFANCVLLTDMSVFELSSLPKLRRVGLVRVNNLTDEAIYALAERHATLERIHLSYCDQISVMAIHFLLQKLHKLTHLSLTGIPSFRQPELQQFCREPPRDFNTAHQLSFCVYSGKGVSQLRAFLTELFDHITEMNGTDDTEYEEDEFDPEAYQEDDTPDPETANEAEEIEEIEEYIARRNFFNSSNITQERGSRHHAPSSNPPQAHEFVFQRERPMRAATILPSDLSDGPSTSHLSASANVHGATSRLNAQILAATPVASPSRRHRAQIAALRGPGDTFPIIETSNSPPPADTASARSSGTNFSNGAGFFRAYHDPVVPSAILARSSGTRTPDLNFAEIGHGRGTQNSHTSPLPTIQTPRRGTETISWRRQPLVENDTRSSAGGGPSVETTPTHTDRLPLIVESPATIPVPLARREQGPSIAWPYRETPTPIQSEGTIGGEHDIRDATRSNLGAEARGRSVKRSLRDTLNVAEHYANSLFFGRNNPQDESHWAASGDRNLRNVGGSSNVDGSSGSGSATMRGYL